MGDAHAGAEAKLLEQIAAGDAASRAVYADWLEECGDGVRAELVRLIEELRGVEPGDQRDRLLERARELARGCDAAWRCQVSRSRVSGCADCRAEWLELDATPHAAVRSCGLCGEPVHYVTTSADHELKAGRVRVAVDVFVLQVSKDHAPLAVLDPAAWTGCATCASRRNKVGFCLDCGTPGPILVDLETISPDQVRCPACGRAVHEWADRCAVCHNRVRADEADDDE